jgi:hypothetical protein
VLKQKNDSEGQHTCSRNASQLTALGKSYLPSFQATKCVFKVFSVEKYDIEQELGVFAKDLGKSLLSLIAQISQGDSGYISFSRIFLSDGFPTTSLESIYQLPFF